MSRRCLRLREQGLAVAIVSSKFRYRIEAILALNELQSLVDVLIGGEDVQRHKPDPEALRADAGAAGRAGPFGDLRG